MEKLQQYIYLILTAILALNLIGCTSFSPPQNLMENASSNSVEGKPADSEFITAVADFSINLFKESADPQENSLVSPLSVSLALSMAANGADNITLQQMEKLLGNDIPITELNEYMYSYINCLPNTEKSKLHIANSIWFNNDKNNLQVESDFLQNNADYYNASIFSAAFDKGTAKDINDWVKINTDGMIEKIIENVDPASMYLINALAFDAEWQMVYNAASVNKGIFTNIKGEVQNVDFMYSGEYTYLEDDMATGFIKPYYGGNYKFVALLPNEGISIGEYVESLSGEGFMNILANSQTATVRTAMPKFEYEYGLSMMDVLKDLGMTEAFDAGSADFSKMAVSAEGNIFIGEVLHKTFIKVDENGTRAGAATMVAMMPASASPEEPKSVYLDRPFVYAIVDSATTLPVFIGVVMTV